MADMKRLASSVWAIPCAARPVRGRQQLMPCLLIFTTLVSMVRPGRSASMNMGERSWTLSQVLSPGPTTSTC